MCIRDRSQAPAYVPKTDPLFLYSLNPYSTPVSYTHLDVYKRQGSSHEDHDSRKEGCQGYINARGLHLQSHEGQRAVSYTHLEECFVDICRSL